MNSSLISHLSQITDPRSGKNRLYPLEEILLLCISAVISGADGWKSIADFGHIKLNWLRKFLPFENEIPSEDCIAWVMARLSPKKFQECFIAWTKSISKLTDGEVVAIDGKTVRGSRDPGNGRAAIHMVSAWANQSSLSLGQIATDEKSNEITAIPKLLNMLDIKGAIVTIDAMGCQKKIAQQIVSREADYILAVKDNQPELHEAIKDYFQTAKDADFCRVPVTYDEQTDAGHGRVEVRRCWLSNDISTLPTPEKWEKLQGIALIESERHEGGKIAYESHYYITTLTCEATKFSQSVRFHWGIENRLHWVLDVTFSEDDCRIRRDNAPANFNTFRQFALNLIRQAKTGLSVKGSRFRAAWDDSFRHNLLDNL